MSKAVSESTAVKNWLVKNGLADAGGTEQHYKNRLAKAIVENKISVDEINKLSLGESNMTTTNKATADELYGGNSNGNGEPNIRIKNASELYSREKSTAVHSKTGKPVINEYGQEARLPSQMEHAKAGALFKMFAKRSGIQVLLSDHEKDLVGECFEKDAWCGAYNGQWVTGFDGNRVKSLLDDATSGGAELVPEWFDDDIVTYPLLHSEVFPFIDLKQVPRGSSVEGGSLGNPTVTWGTAEGTPMGLFDTSSLVAAIDTTIHPVSVAVTCGRDFLSDSPVSVGQVLMQNIGQRMAAEMDRVVVVGNGTSEPEGISVASGTNSINSVNDTTGPPTIADYLALMFGIGKQYRNASMNPFYVSNDTTYQRSRNIKVDPSETSTDQRPVFGVGNVQDYKTLGAMHKVENNLGNSVAIFGALKKYRMYRRQGAEVRWTDGGIELARTNEILLTVRGRYGGQAVDASAFAVSADMQS